MAFAAVTAFYGTSFWLFIRKPRSKNRGVSVNVDLDESRSIFGRRRLPRDEPHLWADRIEDWFARLTFHVWAHYLLIVLLIGYVIFDVITGH